MNRTRQSVDPAALRAAPSEVRRRSRLLASVRARREPLLDRESLKQLRRERDAATVRWRVYDGGNTLHRPEPYLAELLGSHAGVWLEPGATGYAPVRCGIDAAGRVVSARWIDGDGEKDFLTYGPEHDELVALRWDDFTRYRPEVTFIFRDAAGRVEATAKDAGFSLAWTQYIYDARGVLQAAAHYADGEPDPLRITWYSHAADGSLATVEEGEHVVWDARTHSREERLPRFAEIVDGLVEPIARAIGAAVADALPKLPEPVYALSRVAGSSPQPTAILVDRSFVRRMSVEELGRDEIVVAGFGSVGEAGVVDLDRDVLDLMPPDAQRRLRQFRQRADQWMQRFSVEYQATYEWDEPPNPVAVAASVEVLKRLNGEDGLSPLPVIAWSNPHEHDAPNVEDHGLNAPRMVPHDDWWTLTAATAGMATVEALWALLSNP